MTTKTKLLCGFGVAFVMALAGVLIPTYGPILWTLSATLGVAVVMAGLQAINGRIAQLESDLNSRLDQLGVNLAVETYTSASITSRFPECGIPVSGWSMRATNLHAIIDTLERYDSKHVVEFGSGLSTICIASWLKKRGLGTIVSVDHDPQWADLTRSYLNRLDLAAHGKLIVAPLKSYPAKDKYAVPYWYDGNELRSIEPGIDLVIVDGPPAGISEHRMARLPAMEFLYSRLAPRCVVILDDAGREGEKEVVEVWRSQFPEFSHRFVDGFTGLSILERSAGPESRE